MTNQISKEEYELRALENQYIDDLRVKNRIIAELRTNVQLLMQQVQELQHTHDDVVEDVESEVDDE